MASIVYYASMKDLRDSVLLALLWPAGILGGVILLFFFGYVIPGIAISDGTEAYKGNDHVLAVGALEALRGTLSSPGIYRFDTTKFKVTNIEKQKDRCGYLITIRAYTYFGFEKPTPYYIDSCLSELGDS